MITRLTGQLIDWLGSPWAMLLSAALIVGWLLAGPLFGLSDTWQLVINTTTTIITFLMVFVIQNTQNRDGRALQTKLDAIIESIGGADNQLVGIEDLDDRQIREIQQHVRELKDETM